MPNGRTGSSRATARTLFAVLSTVLGVLVVAGCRAGPVATEFVGHLLDADGAPVANAVVYIADDAAASATSVGGAHVHADVAAGSCQQPTEAFTMRTCTDSDGRFSLSVPSPAPTSARLVFESSYWRAVLIVHPLRGGGRVDVAPRLPDLVPADELEAAVRYVLPTLTAFDLIQLNDEKALADLIVHAQKVDADVEPIHLLLPIRHPSGAQQFVPWIAYHHDLRAFGVDDCAIDPDTFADVDCVEVAGPSLTFQGMPWMDAQEMRNLFIGETEKNLADETLHQMSVISIVGDELEATYYGQHLEAPHTPSSLQGLRSVLDTRLDAATVDRLLASTNANYLLHNQIDLDMGGYDDELHVDDAAASATDAAIAPANHVLEDGIKYLRPVMIADSTVYDAVAGERLVPDYFARVDAMANRQDLFFAWANLASDAAPPSLTNLTEYSNAFVVRTRIGGYRRLTEAGQSGFTFPSDRCESLGNGSLMDAYAERSRDANTLENEYWMWWTNTDRYPGAWGCAGGFGTLHETPRGGAVSWTSFRDYTLETVGQTFMHEGGHLVNAVHAASATGTRCRVLGIVPFGVTGPSIMGSTSDRNLRANCFAVTPDPATALRNRTRVAEYLHQRLE